MAAAHQVDKNAKSGRKAGGGDGALEIHEFFEALVQLAFERAQPKFGEMVGEEMNQEVLEPLPNCLETLLTGSILINAKRDELQKTRTLIEKDRRVLKKIRPHRDALLEVFTALSKADATTKAGPVPKLGMDKFCNEMLERKVVGEVKASPTPQVAGEAVPEFVTSLSMADAKQAFISVQVGDNEGETLMFDEFMIALALCGNIKYAQVIKDGEPLELALRCEGIMNNFLQAKDEAQVITDALYPPLVRYDYENSGADPGFIDTCAPPTPANTRDQERAALCHPPPRLPPPPPAPSHRVALTVDSLLIEAGTRRWTSAACLASRSGKRTSSTRSRARLASSSPSSASTPRAAPPARR